MTNNLRRVCVIGAGTMGSGIAAHLANIGIQVSLLDLSLDAAAKGLDRAKRINPPHFYLPETADTITVGAVESSLDLIAQADWVCEAIIEEPNAKRALYEVIEGSIRKDAFVSTNTSGLEITLLAEGRSDEFRRKFLGTHFFNPPRRLKLIELIPTEFTDPEVAAKLTELMEGALARRVVLAKDTPGFIANRFGMWCMYKAIHAAEKLGLTIEEVDEITGPFLGRPRSGSFRLNDVVGLDIMDAIAKNLLDRRPDDPQISALHSPRSMAVLLERGWIGAKAGQGYTRKEGKEFLSFDLVTRAYRNRLEPDLPTIKELGRKPLAERLAAAYDRRDQVGEYLREYLGPALRYAHSIKEEVSSSVLDFDRVMEWGFGWEAGPFAMTDMIGASKLGLESKPWYGPAFVRDFGGEEKPLPDEPRYRTFKDFPQIEKLETITLRDLGDDVTGIGLTAKMGTISPRTVNEITGLLNSGSLKRIVLTSEAACFSAGYDLSVFADCIAREDWKGIDTAIEAFQHLNLMLGRIPSVAAVYGYCLGGGLEMAASCTLIAAAPESQIGLPESRVGLVPGGTGTSLMSLRGQSSAKDLADKVVLLAKGTISTSADHARALGYLRREDVTVYQQDELIARAKELVLGAQPAAHANWQKIGGPVAGMVDQQVEAARKAGDFSAHDALIATCLKDSMIKADSLTDSVVRERKAFIDLCQTGLSQARIKHMLETGKPLKN